MNKYIIKKSSFYIILTFFFITMFLLLTISTIQSIINEYTINNGLLGVNNKRISIEGINNINNNEFLETIKSQKGIKIIKDKISYGASEGIAIYYDKELEINPPIARGKFFSIEDFKNKDPLIIINKDMERNIINQNGIEYIKIANSMYKVIGVLGYEGKSSIYDMQFFINLNSLIFDNNINLFSDLIIDSKDSSNVNKKIEIFMEDLKQLDSEITYKIATGKKIENLLIGIINNGIFAIGIIGVLIVVLSLNVINVTLYWITGKMKEIGIRKALGAKNIDIIKLVFFEYLKAIITSFFLATIVYFIIIKLNLISGFNKLLLRSDFYIESVIMCFIVIITLGIIITIPSINKALKSEISSIMKGGI